MLYMHRYKEVIPYVCSHSCSLSQCHGSSRSPARNGHISVPQHLAYRSTGRWLDHMSPCRSRRHYTDRYLRSTCSTWMSLLTSAASDEIKLLCNTSLIYAFLTLKDHIVNNLQQLNTAYYDGYCVLKIYVRLKMLGKPYSTNKKVEKWA